MSSDQVNIAELRALDANATPGPWSISVKPGSTEVLAGTLSLAGDEQYYPWMFDIEDTRLLVALRNAAPALLDFAERAQEQAKQNEELRAIIGENASAAADRIRAALHGQAERDALKAEVERLKWALERILIGTAATWVGDECRAALRGEEAPRE